MHKTDTYSARYVDGLERYRARHQPIDRAAVKPNVRSRISTHATVPSYRHGRYVQPTPRKRRMCFDTWANTYDTSRESGVLMFRSGPHRSYHAVERHMSTHCLIVLRPGDTWPGTISIQCHVSQKQCQPILPFKLTGSHLVRVVACMQI